MERRGYLHCYLSLPHKTKSNVIVKVGCRGAEVGLRNKLVRIGEAGFCSCFTSLTFLQRQHQHSLRLTGGVDMLLLR